MGLGEFGVKGKKGLKAEEGSEGAGLQTDQVTDAVKQAVA